MITNIKRISKKEYTQAKLAETTLQGKTVVNRLAQVNQCRRSGFIHAGCFFYSVPGEMHFKTEFIDRFLEPGKVD